ENVADEENSHAIEDAGGVDQVLLPRTALKFDGNTPRKMTGTARVKCGTQQQTPRCRSHKGWRTFEYSVVQKPPSPTTRFVVMRYMADGTCEALYPSASYPESAAEKYLGRRNSCTRKAGVACRVRVATWHFGWR